MRTIEIKKSAVVLYKSLGKTNEEMASKFGVTNKEMQEVLITFGLVKSRKPRVEAAYVINTIDDVAALENEFTTENEESNTEEPAQA